MSDKLVLLANCLENLDDLVEMAKGKDLPVQVLVTEKKVLERITKHGAKYVVGVCCPKKIGEVTPYLKDNGIIYNAVPTDAGECWQDTDVRKKIDLDTYCEALDWLCNQ